MSDSPIAIPLSELLLDRYLSGECSLEERHAVDQILEKHSLERDAFVTFVGALDGMDRSVTPAAEALRRLHARNTPRDTADPRVGRSQFTVPPSYARRPFGSTLLNASLAVLLVMAGWIAATHARAKHLSTASEIYTTAGGQRATITLPDGNTVALDVASHLEVPADYLSGNHQLRLIGEALFTIQHHTEAPVTVAAGQTTARVLGTTFIVRRYPSDTVTTVAVREGRVAVGNTVAAANQMLTIQRSGTTTLRPATSGDFSFASGILTLDDQNLADAIPELNRWYDADIRLGDPTLATRGISGTCPQGTLADLSAILELTVNVRVVRDGRVLTLYPK